MFQKNGKYYKVLFVGHDLKWEDTMASLYTFGSEEDADLNENEESSQMYHFDLDEGLTSQDLEVLIEQQL